MTMERVRIRGESLPAMAGPPHAAAPGARRWWAFACVTFLLHYAWELLQGPLYTQFAGLSWTEHALPCLPAALGDVVIAAVAHAFAGALTRRWRWPFERNRMAPALLWLAAGLVITVTFELLAVSWGRWAYTERMPQVLGVGLSPLLQWTLLPPLSLLLACRRPARAVPR